MNEDVIWLNYGEDCNNQTIAISDTLSSIGNITLTNTDLNSIYYKSPLEERIENLEKQLDKIVDFINTFFDTDIKV